MSDDESRRAGPRPTRKSTQARIRIIRAAERQFAVSGIDNASMREISADAGFSNNNAVQYHFGTKDELVRAVFEYRYVPLDEERRRLLATLPARPTLQNVVDTAAKCLVLPPVTLLDDPEGSYHLRFTAQLHQQPQYNVLTADGDLRRELFGGSDDVLRSIFQLLEAHLPDLPAGTLPLRDRLAYLLVTNAMSAREDAEQNPRNAVTGRETFTAELLRSVQLILAGP